MISLDNNSITNQINLIIFFFCAFLGQNFSQSIFSSIFCLFHANFILIACNVSLTYHF